MAAIINPDTGKLKNEAFDISEMGHVSVDITRSMFDGKMAAILSGTGEFKLSVMYSNSQ